MEKIKKLIPAKIQTIGSNVTVSEKLFDEMIQRINECVLAINMLIDITEDINNHIDSSDAHIKTLQNSIQALANALKVITED